MLLFLSRTPCHVAGCMEYQIQVYTCALSFGSIWPCCGIICSSGPLYQTYVDNCEAVPCPFNSSGVSISHGCRCNAGYRGHIEAATGFPYYTGACVAVECPANSSGDSLPVGCRCLPGYAGDIKATKKAPYYRSTCAAVDCPAGSVGASVASGCSCAPGFQGEISAESEEPFYSGTCFHQKPCLRHSVFRHFRRQCQCFPGYKDAQGSCVALECPQNSIGINLPMGCHCKPGYRRASSERHQVECSPAPCPDNSVGDLATGCRCLLGFSGSLFPTSVAPYYGGSCEKDITWQDVELTSNGLESLLLALPRTKIRALDLSKSTWVPKRAKLLADAIPKSRVTDLIMDYTDLDDHNFAFLAKVLSESNLQSLRLRYSFLNLNVLALKELAVHLPKSHLKELNLFHSFHWEGIEAQANIFEDFAASLAKSQLKELTLGGYGLAKED